MMEHVFVPAMLAALGRLTVGGGGTPCLSSVGNDIIKRQALSREGQQCTGLSETVIPPNLGRTETAFWGGGIKAESQRMESRLQAKAEGAAWKEAAVGRAGLRRLLWNPDSTVLRLAQGNQ